MTELLVTELTLTDTAAERAFLRAPEAPALPAGCLRIVRARTARPHTYAILTWWTDGASRKAFESSGEAWPGAEVAGITRMERSGFTSLAPSTIRAHCEDCSEVAAVTVRPAGETCSLCGAALPGRVDTGVLPSPPSALPTGVVSELRGIDLEPATRQAVEAYFTAWNTEDAAARRALLDASLTDAARYQDPAAEQG